MNSSFQKAVLVLLLAALTPYLWLSFYAHPAADDFFYPALVPRHDLWLSFSSRYMEWGGRYSAIWLELANPLYAGLSGYVWALLGFHLATFLAILFFIHSIRIIRPFEYSPLSVSLFLWLSYLASMPALSEGTYWYPALSVYQAGLITALFYAGMAIRLFNENYFISREVHFVLTLILLFASAGFSEVLTLLLLGIHAATIFMSHRSPSRMRLLVVLSLVLITGAVCMIAAPGNTVRSAHFPENHDLVYSAGMSLLQTVRFACIWILQPGWILFSLWLLTGRGKEFPTIQFPFKHPWFFIMLGMILFACAFPPYWSTGILGQHRTINLGCFFFLLAWILFLSSVGEQWHQRFQMLISFRKYFLPASVIAFIFFGNSSTAIMDLITGKAATFDREMDQRWHLLESNRNTNSFILLDTLSERPGSLMVLEPSSDTTYWVNYCQAKYYGLKAMGLRK